MRTRMVLAAAATAGAVTLAGGGDGFWLCLPVVLVVCASSRTRVGAALRTAAIVGSAALPEVVSTGIRRLPSLPLVLTIPAVSAVVLVAVRERLERERDELRRFALSDPLTGIANRRSLLARVEYEVPPHTRAQSSFALLMLDLDGFKDLNDRFGHAAGDDLLRDVAAAVERTIRGQDTVARIGGDEFCVLAPQTDLAGAARLVARIERAVSEVTAGVEALHASSGIALFPDDGASASSLLHAADQRLLGVKRQRTGTRGRRRAA